MNAQLDVVEPRASPGIRGFVPGDIPQVARLHARVWPNPDCTFDVYEDYFQRVFVDNPEADQSLPSLVSEDERGRIVAFIGVVPRRVVLGQRAYLAALSSQFIVEPEGPAAFVAIRILRAYFDGPQDVSIADEATDAARRLWMGLGGTTAQFLSMYWTRVLRPARYATSLLRARQRWSWLARVAAPCAVAADAVAACLPGTPFRQSSDPVSVDTLTTAMIMNHSDEFCDPSGLSVRHDERSFQWLLERIARACVNGEPISGAVTRSGQMCGWYVAALDGSGHCDLVHLASDRTSHRVVLDQLFHHACTRGALAVTGRIDPPFMEALSDSGCLFHRRGPWLLVRTPRPEILHAFESGHACFARIDGEWALRLSASRARGAVA